MAFLQSTYVDVAIWNFACQFVSGNLWEVVYFKFYENRSRGLGSYLVENRPLSLTRPVAGASFLSGESQGRPRHLGGGKSIYSCQLCTFTYRIFYSFPSSPNFTWISPFLFDSCGSFPFLPLCLSLPSQAPLPFSYSYRGLGEHSKPCLGPNYQDNRWKSVKRIHFLILYEKALLRVISRPIKNHACIPIPARKDKKISGCSGRPSVGGEIWGLDLPPPLNPALLWSAAGAARVKTSNERSGERDSRKWSWA